MRAASHDHAFAVAAESTDDLAQVLQVVVGREAVAVEQLGHPLLDAVPSAFVEGLHQLTADPRLTGDLVDQLLRVVLKTELGRDLAPDLRAATAELSAHHQHGFLVAVGLAPLGADLLLLHPAKEVLIDELFDATSHGSLHDSAAAAMTDTFPVTRSRLAGRNGARARCTVRRIALLLGEVRARMRAHEEPRQALMGRRDGRRRGAVCCSVSRSGRGARCQCAAGRHVRPADGRDAGCASGLGGVSHRRRAQHHIRVQPGGGVSGVRDRTASRRRLLRRTSHGSACGLGLGLRMGRAGARGHQLSRGGQGAQRDGDTPGPEDLSRRSRWRGAAP